jgi:serine/threonine protein kinase/tetratricopeptide (TPR) repeat protein
VGPELRQRVDRLFDQILSLDPGQRTAFLDEACAGEPTVRAEVESLLQHHDRAEQGGFLEAVSDGSVTGLQTGPNTPGPLGPPPAVAGYEILGELGRGGMGVVYEARQKGLNRRVALKMIRAGADAGPHELARFKAEAEAVARLHHPHIVQIHEIGEVEGRPYFSLEFVAGGSLAQQLDGTPWPAQAAAHLVETLARAVHHAHQQGIIHRDLKPGNILLQMQNAECRMQNEKPDSAFCILHSAFCIPKVTDFGLAKRLDSAAGQTQSGDILGTPSYMAPEQAEGRTGAGDARTDVYALGAILYELLTGRPPFRGVSALDTLVLVRSQEPVPLSRLQPGVPRDLETICLHCLQKDSAKRYVSAEALAQDLGHFLAGEPIQARPVGPAVRLLRWCRRKPLVASLAAGLMLVFLAGFGGVTWQWARAEEERGRAEQNLTYSEQQRQRAREAEARAKRRFDDVRQLAHAFIFDFDDQLHRLPGSIRAREFLAQTALKYLDKLRKDAAGNALLLRELCNAYVKVGDLQGDPQGRNLNDTTAALASYRKSLALAKGLVQADANNIAAQQCLMHSWQKIGAIQAVTSQTLKALDNFRKALNIQEHLARRDAGNLSKQLELLRGYRRIGSVQLTLGRTTEALASFRKSLRIAQRLFKDNPHDPRVQLEVWFSSYQFGRTQANLGQTREALASHRQSLTIAKELFRTAPNDARYRHNLAATYGVMGDREAALGRYRHSLENYGKFLKIMATLARAGRDDAFAQDAFAYSQLSMGRMHWLLGQLGEALLDFNKSREVYGALAKRDPKNTWFQLQLSSVHRLIGETEEKMGQPTQALESVGKCLEILKPLAKADPANAINQNNLAACYVTLGWMQERAGHKPDALVSYRRGVRMAKAQAKADPQNDIILGIVTYGFLRIAYLQIDLGESREALESAEKGLVIRQAQAKADPANHVKRLDLALSNAQLGLIHARLGADSRQAKGDRLMHWRQAWQWHQRARHISMTMPADAIPPGWAIVRPDRLGAELSRCDTAITDLANREKSTSGAPKRNGPEK